MNRNFRFCEGEFYHLYNRGVEKRIIFNDVQDYKRFILLLYVANTTKSIHLSNLPNQGRSLMSIIEKMRKTDEERLTDIGAYCLMPNHFHLLTYESAEGGASKFMSKLLTGYAMYFNKKYERTGSLFEGRFKAKHIGNNDNYLKYLFAYIHLNPVKIIDSKWKEKGVVDIIKTKKFLKEYKYSSYLDYFGENRTEKNIINNKKFPEYFENSQDFENSIYEWLEYDEYQ